MAARSVTQESTQFRVTSIEPLFRLDLPNFVGISYDVSPDAKQFVVQTTDHTKSTSDHVGDELSRRNSRSLRPAAGRCRIRPEKFPWAR